MSVVCEMCNSELHSRNALLKHQGKCRGEYSAKVYVCEVCNKEVDDEETLEGHAKKCAHLMKQITECRNEIKILEDELKDDIYHYALYFYGVVSIAKDQIRWKENMEWLSNNPLNQI